MNSLGILIFSPILDLLEHNFDKNKILVFFLIYCIFYNSISHILYFTNKILLIIIYFLQSFLAKYQNKI